MPDNFEIRFSSSSEETMEIAEDLARGCKKGDIFCLSGDLGAGKTVFAKGLAKGLGVLEDITSPTFAIINEHEGNLPFYHFDVYRINNVDEMYDTNFEDYFYGEGVCLVEWAEIIKDLIPGNAVWITILKNLSKGGDFRQITIRRT